MSQLSLPKGDMKVLLLEGVHANAVELFGTNGFSTVMSLPKAVDGYDLAEMVSDVHILGIRSRTQLTEDVLAAAKNLMAVGCFCIGTNQVDLKAAKLRGIPVFNAPYSNTRSVAELIIGEIIMLARGVPQRSWSAHEGGWQKTVAGACEVRGKTLGIVGYGHIGSQVSVLAESLGMRVVFYDVIDKLTLGNATSARTMGEVLAASDFLTLHVPASETTKGLIGEAEIAAMKDGAYLLNASRGDVVDIDALAAALASGKLAGAAVDVFPVEPSSTKDVFESPLRGMRNVILTPHIGGSTVEAQANIGNEVADKLVKYAEIGSTFGSVNFPEVQLPVMPKAASRLMHIHRNVPGVMSRINAVFAEHGINVGAQYLKTDEDIGYVVADIDQDVVPGQGIRKALESIPGTIRTRFLK